MREGIPKRSEVPDRDTWDLSGLCVDSDAWEEGLKLFTAQIPELAAAKGSLGDSVDNLVRILDLYTEHEKLGERLGAYAHLRTAEDGGDDEHQARMARFMRAAPSPTAR